MRIRWPARLVVVSAVVAMAGCGGGDDEGPTADDGIRIASFDFAESELVAELYARALEEVGLPVVRLGQIGPREVVAPALELDRIDLVPEYLGTASAHFGAETADVQGLAAALAPRGLVVLEPAPAQDVNVFVVTEATAGRLGAATLSDLRGSASGLRFGGPVECPDRPLCLAGLVSTYGLEFAEFVPQRSLAVTAEALIREEIDIGVMFSTAAELSSGSFVVLDDDRSLQPPENLVAVARRAAIERWGPGMVDMVESVSRVLTTDELQAMNRRVAEGEPVAVVATTWLESVGLVAG